MYRIVASDMDETFIAPDHTVNPRNFEAARLMREAGVRFVVATGRPFYSVRGTLAELGTLGDADELTITLNGGYVARNDGTPIATHTLDDTVAEALFAEGLARGLCVHTYLAERTLTTNMDAAERAYLNGRMEVEDWPERSLAGLGEPVFKILYESEDFEGLHRVREEMEAERPELMAGLAVSFSSFRYLEFNPKGVDKGRGLADVAAALGVPMAETVAVGDSANDLAMLVEAGLGLGVANSSAAVTDVLPPSRILASSADDGALMEVWERYVRPSL